MKRTLKINVFFKRSIFPTWTILFFLISIILISCKDDDDDDTDLVGNWVKLSYFDGMPRKDAVAFTINGKGYIGTGYNSTDKNNVNDRYKDFWEYDKDKNTWTQKADFAGIQRSGAVGFATDTKGYIGTGYDGMNKLKDFWEYNPESNEWTQKADFGGTERYGAVAFAINNKGYVGTGFNTYNFKDFWEFNPDADSINQWTKKVSFGGNKRSYAVAFTVNGLGYICGGIDNSSYETDLWEYNPTTDLWAEKNKIVDRSDSDLDNDYTSIRGIYKVAFTINDKAYIATGGEGTAGNKVWEYDQAKDLWAEKTSFEGSGRIQAVAFSIGDRGYVTTGSNGSTFFDDIWAFDPNAEYDEED